MFCKIDSVMVSSLGAHGGVTFKLILLASGLTGVLAKCTCLALQSVQGPNHLMCHPLRWHLLIVCLPLGDSSYLLLPVNLLDMHLC